jgi:transcriptional regulator with XRE-family HTH domain
MSDPEMRALVEQELEALRVGAAIARLRQRRHMSLTELAAQAGMSAPNVSRIETSRARNMTLETLVELARALGREVRIAFPARRTGGTRGLRAAKA